MSTQDKQIKTGGCAFPVKSLGFEQHGMTLRSYFAAHALIALPHMGCGADLDIADTASAAFQLADAMIKASNESHPYTDS